MHEEMGMRFWVDQDDVNAASRLRESAFGAVVLHLAALVMLLISPGDARAIPFLFPAQPVEVVELFPLIPLENSTPLFVPPDAIRIPEDNTPDDLTPEESERMVLRTPEGEDPEAGQVFSLPAQPKEPAGGGDPSQAESLIPGEAKGSEAEEAASAEDGKEAWEKQEQEVALLDIPRPLDSVAAGEKFLEKQSPNQALRESLTQSLKDREGGFVGPGDEGWVSDPNLNLPFPTILSDTRGVDFAPYLARVLIRVRDNWYGLMPDSVRIGESGSVVIVFTILKDGSLQAGDPQIVASSQKEHLDRPALGAVRSSQPFSALPKAFTGDFIKLQLTFLYNIPIEAYAPPGR